MKDWYWDHYEPTLPMSTYLVAFVISEFAYQEKEFKTVSGKTKQFRVWSRPDAINQTDYAFTITPKLLEYFGAYFDVEFPLPKIDLVAVPDFGKTFCSYFHESYFLK